MRLTQKIDYIKMALIVLHPHTTGQKNRLSFFPKTFNGFGLLLFFEFNGIIPKEKYVCFYQGTLGYQQFYKKFNIKKHFKIRKNIWCHAAFFGNNYTMNINNEYFIKCYPDNSFKKNLEHLVTKSGLLRYYFQNMVTCSPKI